MKHFLASRGKSKTDLDTADEKLQNTANKGTDIATNGGIITETRVGPLNGEDKAVETVLNPDRSKSPANCQNNYSRGQYL